MEEDKTAAQELIDKFSQPGMNLSTDQRNKAKLVGAENSVRQSLVELILGQFNKVAAYDVTISKIMSILTEKAQLMETNELLGMLAVLSKASGNDSKTILEMFKRPDSDLKRYVSELQKIVGEKENIVDAEVVKEEVTINLSPEKQERVLRLLEKMQAKDREAAEE